ncbi:hypothetical protein GUJ93_ZPchr0012g21832 [Zizania palustris]|uniref:Uncharacterized protein n=1 Tax=Zizania palustris TaxID=103762 RepID=A0A8J6BTP1_ZIZPA|nr:hypothetical protein GUJ93_ZPchr0012g21832 [Zizania palustris]
MRKQRSSCSSSAAVSLGKLVLLMVMVFSLIFALHTASVDAARAPGYMLDSPTGNQQCSPIVGQGCGGHPSALP